MACTYHYVAYREEGFWVVRSPQVPGVYGWARTYAAAYRDFLDALETHEVHRRASGRRPRTCAKPPFRTGKVRV